MSSPVPLKAAVYMYHKGTNENWLTGRVAANRMLSAVRTKAEASKWVIEKQGMYYTIRLMNTRRYLAAGSLTKTGDCTAVLTTSPSGMAHLWNISTSSTGIRISTAAACRERGANVKQFLKIAGTGGPHLELASRDSDVFYVVRANPSSTTSTPPVTVRPGGAPAAVGSVRLRMKPVTEIPKIVAIEPYLRPRYFLAPNNIPTGSGKEGSVSMTVSRAFWYTQPTQNTISFLTGPTGPHLTVDRVCSSPILYSGVLTSRARFYVATVQGADGFVLKTDTNACGDGRARYLVTHTNGRPGVSKTAPTQQTMLQYLWRFTVGSVTTPPSIETQPPVPVETPASVPIPPPTFIPETRRPIVVPTIAPTVVPTFGPEQPALPTFGPTFAPTTAPTTIPTYGPVGPFPTLPPTDSPTTLPPTDSPTSDPSTFEPSFSPSGSPTSTPAGGYSGSININIEDGRKWGNDRVVFPYPVAPDLLLASNPDGSLALPEPTAVGETTVSPSASAEPDESSDAATEAGEVGDVLFPAFEGDAGDGSEGDLAMNSEMEFDEPFWTMPRIAMALIAFIVVAIIAYYVYQSYATPNGNGSGNGTGNGGKNGGKNGPTTVNGGTNAGRGTNGASGGNAGRGTNGASGGNVGRSNATTATNISSTAMNALAPPANNLGNLGDFGAGDTGNLDAFGDGFNDFANVNDIGPPPPTGR